MVTTIDENLTTEQEIAIDNQDLLDEPGTIDVNVLEETVADVPEQQPTAQTEGDTLSAAETMLSLQERDRQRAEDSRTQALQLAEQQSEQELMVQALAGQTLGEGRAVTQALAESGVNDRQREIDSLDAAILSASTALKRRIARDEADIQSLAGSGRGIPASVVRGRQALMQQQRNAQRKVEAIELENDIATSELLQGKVDNARKAIERSVELQFEDKRAELELEKTFLERIDTKEARAREEALSREEKEIENAKEQANAVFDISVMASRNGAPASVIKEINRAKTKEEALEAVGQYAQDPLETELMRLNIKQKSLDIKEQEKKLNAVSNPYESLNIKPNFQTATYAQRLTDAENSFEGLSLPQLQIAKTAQTRVGGVLLPNIALGDEIQKFNQAERNFINAVLRRESGAAIAPDEFVSARKQYIPQPGDTQETLDQKARNREVVRRGLVLESGGAYEILETELDINNPDELLESFDEGDTQTTEEFFSDF